MMVCISSMWSVARGSTKRGRSPATFTSSGISTPSSRMSAWKVLRVPSVSSRMVMPRSAARALILSSTSVTLRA
jgi:hypothetical protein